jgi:AcrR family transcriptional regulator
MAPQVESARLAPKEQLLAAAMAHVEQHGLSDLSLRELAGAIGTSHRMLIYHFGSKEGLLVAIVQTVEAAQRQFLQELTETFTLDAEAAVRTMWERFANPALWANERLFFEVYAQALQGRPGTAGFLDDIIDSWVRVSARYAIGLGVREATAEADARLSVAVVRGLLLDLLATRDRGKVDLAFERYLELYRPALVDLPRAP